MGNVYRGFFEKPTPGVPWQPMDYSAQNLGGLGAAGGQLTSSYVQSSSHEEAISNIQRAAMLKDLELMEDSYRNTKIVAEQRLEQVRQSTKDAKRLAASELGALVTQPGQHFTGDVVLGWTENYLTQLTPTSIATGAATRAAEHFAEMKSALSLGVVKDLAELSG